MLKSEICYSRTTLYSSDYFEVVRCEWKKGDASPLHDHRWSQCSTFIEHGVFANRTVSGLNDSQKIFEPGQTIHVPPGAQHEMSCLSEAGSTLHVYTPRISDKPAPTVFSHPNADTLKKELSLGLDSNGISWAELIQSLAQLREKSVNTHSVYFMNQLFSGVLPEVLASENILAETRTTMATFEASPALSLVELELMKKLSELIGWHPDDADGVMVPGGSAANFMALHCARIRKKPELKKTGLFQSQPMRIFCSSEAHYSMQKACVALGFGTDSLVHISVDQQTGAMNTDELKKSIALCIEQSCLPLMVCATAGTTVKGAFDPIEDIAEICAEHQIWLHVDGAWGGPVIFSERHRALLKGLLKADSMTFDAHKLFGAGLTSSVFIAQDGRILLQANDVSGGEYLFHNGSEFIDRGRLSWQCGRRADALSFWTIWKSYGTNGLGQFVDRQMDLQSELTAWIRQQPRLRLIAEPEYLNICVQVLPPAQNPESDTKKWSEYVRNSLKQKNQCLVNYSTECDGTTFLRLILAHPQLTLANLQQILQWALAIT
jgi:glutamate/tyrosine decarboxylase-like PLP-dependent enzyme/quercetin dioxygenase-like cupin family protein